MIMKKIHSFVLTAAMILSAVSCQKELVNDNFETTGGDYTITAVASVDSKAVLEGVNTYWTPGDKISVFDAAGAAVQFGTDITSKAASAKFTNEAEFAVPEKLVALYPAKADATVAENGEIGILRIGGTQTAKAGTFDPAFAYAAGTADAEGNVVFNHVNCLFKFTIGGETAPKSVVLTNGGARQIAGQYKYNIETGKIIQTAENGSVLPGAKSITLTPAEGESFEVGKTYYIVAIPGGNFANITLAFDETVVKTIEGARYADATNGEFIGKIINLGTVAFPAADPDPVEKLEATVVRALQSQEAVSYMTTFGGTANSDRNMATDGEYIYIAETQATPVLWKISIADGSAEKMPVGTVDGGGTFALACPRMIKNTDPGINGGKDVLAVCNMGQGTAVYLYLYANGTDVDPVKISLHYDGLSRRLGDQFTVSGTLQSGYVWCKEQGSNAVMLNQLVITSENISRFAAEGIWPERVMLPDGADTARGSFYFYPGADWSEAIYSSTGSSAYVTRNEGVMTAGKPTYQTTDFSNSYTGCHGFNFFKYNGKDYIAYTSFPKQTLYIIEGAADSKGVKAALDAQKIVFEAKIAAEGNTCGSGNSGADCAVVQKNDKTYVAGHVQNVGVVVYELK